MKVLKKRIWLDENIGMLAKSPKEYYKGIFKEIVVEIKENKKYLKNYHMYAARDEM
ncbi:MAG: hypothetical protein KGD74_12560 [Candidatus Lokiarchaeota archaeon]|nr:hypothetical protein [Candidatus Lokiarchaeota archaeon]